MTDIDIDHLNQWIGRTETRTDVVTASLIERYRATIFDHLWPTGDAAPMGLHWCLAPIAIAGNELGHDGHPQKGGFLPPIPLPSRMWAGGEVRFHSPLMEGDSVNRNSRIASITQKTGSSGPLVFVAVEHEYSVGDRVAISERQDLVYKHSAPKNTGSSAENKKPPTVPDAIIMDEVTLFRYSALTFNGHRIHYDRDYARSEEGYPGLVVHGPLQATLLMNHAAHLCEGIPARFSYRGVSPLFDHTPFQLKAAESTDRSSPDAGKVWCEDLTGKVTMQADYSKA